MALEIFTITKRINNGMFMLKAENHLFGFKNPKILFTIIQPAQDNSGKYVSEKAFLDIQEVFKLIRGIQFYNPQLPNADSIIKSYKGGHDKKINTVVSRIFHVNRKIVPNKPPMIIFSIELADGEQAYITNKYGKQIPGVVKPKRGGKTYYKGSIALNKDEAIYVASILDKEMQSWRTALNIDYMYHPDKYKVVYQNNNVSTNNPNNQYNQRPTTVPVYNQQPQY